MNDLQSRTRCLSESKSHSQFLSQTSLHSSHIQFDTLTPYPQLSQQRAFNKIKKRERHIDRADRIRSVSLSSHIPCSPSSSRSMIASFKSSYNKKEERNSAYDFVLNDENSSNNNNLISESEFLTVKYNLLNKLNTICKQTMLRNLVTNDRQMHSNMNESKQKSIAHALKAMIFLYITEFECVKKIQKELRNMAKQNGKAMVINALNIEILIKHQNISFCGTLTNFLYNKVSACKSLLLIYDWHEIAKLIVENGGNIPNLLNHTHKTHTVLLRMSAVKPSVEYIRFEWNMPKDTIANKNLFLYCLTHNICPFMIDIDSGTDIDLRNAHRCNIESDLLLIYVLQYQSECWNEWIFEWLGQRVCNGEIEWIIIDYCYDRQALLQSFAFVFEKLWRPLTIKMYDNNSKNSNLLRYIAQRGNGRSITLCILYSILRKKETGISAIKKILNLCIMYESSEKSVNLLVNNVLKYHEILKSRLFAQLIECNDYKLMHLLLKNDILMDSQCSGLSFALFGKLCLNISDSHLSQEFVRFNCAKHMYAIINFCHTNNDEMDMINVFNNKRFSIDHKNGKNDMSAVIEGLLFRGVRPFATLTINGNIPTILYERMEVFNDGMRININHYNILILFIIYFKFKKVKIVMRDLLKAQIPMFNNDLCNVINTHLYISNGEIDLFFQKILSKRNSFNFKKNIHFSTEYILEQHILGRFVNKKERFNTYYHERELSANGIEAYWDWIYLILINNKRFIDYLLTHKYHRLWLLKLIKEIIKNLYKLNHSSEDSNKLNQIKRISGFAKVNFSAKELSVLNLLKLSANKRIKKQKKQPTKSNRFYTNAAYFGMRRINSL